MRNEATDAMSKKMRNLLGLAAATLMLATISGCAADTSDDGSADEGDTDATESEVSALRAGVNSKGCRRSAYNCALHPGTGTQRVRRADGSETWSVDPQWLSDHSLVDPATKKPGVPVLDGNGELMAYSPRSSFTLNYGQTRRLGNLTYVMALSAGIGSAGWIPLDAFQNAGALRAAVGEVNAHGTGLADLACYVVKTTFDASLDKYAVVKNATDANKPEPNDYLPMKRANGKVYVNLAFSAPGDGLGAPAVDIFPAGTKFQRLDVPTWEAGSAPSLDVKLYSKPAGGSTYSKLASRDMKFIYGYVKSKSGVVRYGWMALDGLTPSSGCPNR
jgi:hypothetical protein